ncbi:histidine kinase dimerization/phosphoacceptor domain -containing protein [Zavarzinia sp.]|uniref:histidine kinase dimerization/phosphoacceptor domain -containing protein n=1 Tax=Zavarzinia sp. TaxID=2027920 RepID=UPI003565F0B4
MARVFRLLDPLRARLTALMLLVLAAPVGGGVLVAIQAYDEQTARAETQVHQFAALAASHERDFFADTWRLLVGLATDLRLPDPGGRCPRLFGAFLDIYPEYGRLSLIDPDGLQVCSTDRSQAGKGPVKLADADWFQSAVQTRDFSLSDQVTGPAGANPTMVAAMPILGDNDTLTGVIAVDIKLDRLEKVARDAGLPDDGVVYVLDRHGGVLTRRTGGVEGDGGLPQPDLVTKVVDDEILEFRAESLDGRERAYSTVVLQGGAVHVLFGLPVASTFTWIEYDLQSRLALLGLTLVAALLAAFVAGHLLVTRWVRNLHGLAADYAAGRLDRRAELTGAPVELRELGAGFTAMARRVALREAELKRTIGEKDLLIREIHHRVKNNLQTVLSTLGLRLRAAKGEEARTALAEVEMRVRALALVQRHLYLDDATSLVDATALVSELAASLLAAQGAADRVTLEIALPPLAVDQDRATPLALLVTELITNAVGHGFAGGRAGRLSLTGTRDGETVTITLADDGIGFEAEATSGLGLALVPGLVKQLGGESRLDSAPGRGTRWTISFPAPPLAAAG